MAVHIHTSEIEHTCLEIELIWDSTVQHTH